VRTRTWIGLALLLAIVAVVYTRATACGCSLRQVLSWRLSQELDHVAVSQKTFYKQHGRYARTIAEIRYPLDPAFSMQFGAVRDLVQLTATSARVPGLRCVLELTPRQWLRGKPQCTYQPASSYVP